MTSYAIFWSGKSRGGGRGGCRGTVLAEATTEVDEKEDL